MKPLAIVDSVDEVGNPVDKAQGEFTILLLDKHGKSRIQVSHKYARVQANGLLNAYIAMLEVPLNGLRSYAVSRLTALC